MNEIETFHGWIENTADALRVFELCRQGRLGRVRRRLHEKERRLIRSGSVFVFDEQESGIRRWTDGRLWSPSRILGNFLIYRELERRTEGTKRGPSHSVSEGVVEMESLLTENRTRGGLNMDVLSSITQESSGNSWFSPSVSSDEYNSNTDDQVYNNHGDLFCTAPSTDDYSELYVNPQKILDYDSIATQRFMTRETGENYSPTCAASLLGPNAFRLLKSKKLQNSLTPGVTRYIFKPDGLLKKTISAKVDGRTQHLVCYFSESDFIASHGGGKTSPLMEELRRTRIPADLALQQGFRKQMAMEPRRRRHSAGERPVYPKEEAWRPFTEETIEYLDPTLQLTDPSTGNIMESCMRMVMGEYDLRGDLGGGLEYPMMLGSQDPVLPIMDDDHNEYNNE